MWKVAKGAEVALGFARAALQRSGWPDETGLQAMAAGEGGGIRISRKAIVIVSQLCMSGVWPVDSTRCHASAGGSPEGKGSGRVLCDDNGRGERVVEQTSQQLQAHCVSSSDIILFILAVNRIVVCNANGTKCSRAKPTRNR